MSVKETPVVCFEWTGGITHHHLVRHLFSGPKLSSVYAFVSFIVATKPLTVGVHDGVNNTPTD